MLILWSRRALLIWLRGQVLLRLLIWLGRILLDLPSVIIFLMLTSIRFVPPIIRLLLIRIPLLCSCQSKLSLRIMWTIFDFVISPIIIETLANSQPATSRVLLVTVGRMRIICQLSSWMICMLLLLWSSICLPVSILLLPSSLLLMYLTLSLYAWLDPLVLELKLI